jgi:hypothetical protein
VDLREGRIGEEDEGEFAGRTAAQKFRGVGVKHGDGGADRPAVEAQARVAVGDGDGARHEFGPMGSADLACS